MSADNIVRIYCDGCGITSLAGGFADTVDEGRRKLTKLGKNNGKNWETKTNRNGVVFDYCSECKLDDLEPSDTKVTTKCPLCPGELMQMFKGMSCNQCFTVWSNIK